MYPFGIATANEEPSGLNELYADLSSHGSVVIIRNDHPPTLPHTDQFPHNYWYSDNGTWVGKDSTTTLTALLEDLAPNHKYAILVDRSSMEIPHIVIGDSDYDGPVLQRVASLHEVSIPAVIDELEEYEPIVTLETLVSRIKDLPGADRSGAIATFTGRVRERDSPDDASTTHLEFEKYDHVADEKLKMIEEELESRDGVHAVLLHHRTGRIESGEDIVFVVVLAGHRNEAFNTVQDGINRLKDEVPIFKKEVTTEESFWVHNRP